MRNKKVFALVAIGIIVCFALVGMAMAYFSDNASLDDEYSAGVNTIEVEKTYEPPQELHEGDNIFKKEVRIHNTGSVPCFVRVFVDFSDSKTKANAYYSSAANVTNASDPSWSTVAEYVNSKLPTGWVYKPINYSGKAEILDGYFYYTKPLEPGEYTDYLLRSVKMHYDNADTISDVEIVVLAESVQTVGDDGTDYALDTIDGWSSAWKGFLSKNVS